jgi:hypothetical protein
LDTQPKCVLTDYDLLREKKVERVERQRGVGLEWRESYIKMISKVSISLDEINCSTMNFGNNMYISQYLSV